MKSRQAWILLPLFGLLSWGLVRSLIDPNMGKPQAFKFPAQVPLTGWQVVNRQAIVDPAHLRADILSSQRYQYRQGTYPLVLTAEARYVLPRKIPVETKEFLNLFLLDQKKAYQALPFKPVEQEFQPGSFYSVFTYQGRAYLSACIDPSGKSTTNSEQFRRNRLAFDLTWDKVLRWPFSSAGLLDQRCVWSQLSLPLKQAKPEPTYTLLKSAWADWFKWWQTNFPDR